MRRAISKRPQRFILAQLGRLSASAQWMAPSWKAGSSSQLRNQAAGAWPCCMAFADSGSGAAGFAPMFSRRRLPPSCCPTAGATDAAVASFVTYGLLEKARRPGMGALDAKRGVYRDLWLGRVFWSFDPDSGYSHRASIQGRCGPSARSPTSRRLGSTECSKCSLYRAGSQSKLRGSSSRAALSTPSYATG